MGLAVRIIPSILTRGRQQVKGKRFDSWRSVGVTAQAVRIHAARFVDEVCLLDIGATPEGRGPDLELVRELSEVLFCPLAVGGGVRSLEDVKALLRAGADKVVIGTAIVQVPNILQSIADSVGSQAVIAAVDYGDLKNGKAVAVGCGKAFWAQQENGEDKLVPPVLYAQMCERYGAGEILLTSIDREGTLEGYDLELIRGVSESVSIPVIAHGGCRDYEDMVAAIHAGASAVAAGALFQFTDSTPKGAAQYLAKEGIEVRL